MNSTYYDGYQGPISTATGAVNADYVLVQMCAAVATGASTPEARCRGSGAALQAVFPATGPVRFELISSVIAGWCDSDPGCVINGEMDCFARSQ